MTYPARVAEKAASFKPATVLLSILVAPFYVVGFLAGVVWLLLSWAFAAVAVGFGAVKPKADRAD